MIQIAINKCANKIINIDNVLRRFCSELIVGQNVTIKTLPLTNDPSIVNNHCNHINGIIQNIDIGINIVKL